MQNRIDSRYQNASDSKYHPGDCKCEKRRVETNILIECQSCIDGGRRHGRRRCTCETRTIIHTMCSTCAMYRDKLDELHSELDDALYTLSCNIKGFCECQPDVDEVTRISIEMRLCNHHLLQNLVRVPEPDIVVGRPEPAIEEPEPAIEEPEPVVEEPEPAIEEPEPAIEEPEPVVEEPEEESKTIDE